MREVDYHGENLVVSRVRDGLAECVNSQGRVLRIPISELPPTRMVHRGVVPGAVPFAQRPRSFLSELRNLRDVDLAKRVKDKKARGQTKASDDTHSPVRKSQSRVVDAALQQAMSGLDPIVAASLAAQLSALKPKKGKRK